MCAGNQLKGKGISDCFSVAHVDNRFSDNVLSASVVDFDIDRNQLVIKWLFPGGRISDFR